MSIITDMKPIILQRRKTMPTNSGAPKYEWEDDKAIDVAIYLIDDMKNTQSVRYNESTNTGITFFKNIDKNNNRLKDGSVIYTITKVNNKGRFTTLLLKAIDIDV
ncbi:hypothetical protein NE398_20600 [Clostridium tertium]|jgi:hypothetical protein|uniref:Phage head-tail joining protein n=1 Tax=Clostridium tertium TaxID=1559 RepID=A0A9X3XQY5_9CLOT|nr:hypothetical protein [Clostridium tertium]MDC4242534.1 hypothetical protein [Clostridium tertium]